MFRRAALKASLLLLFTGAAGAQNVTPFKGNPGWKPIPAAVNGRVYESGSMLLRQWPGTYFETAVTGASLLFRVGEGDVSLRISADGRAPVALVRPKPGYYRIGDLGPGMHVVRVQVASESQDGPTAFGGFFEDGGNRAASVAPLRLREIEFIGDSHTVGYGNTSPKRQCTKDEIWTTTDTTRGVPALTAGHYDADYQVNAISGRGIVRNYGGFAADTLPQVYPYTLFDKAERYPRLGWNPQLIVISLGTNDFSTPLHAGEKWASREVLQQDYETTFASFVEDLRKLNPHARFLFWAANPSEEISTEIEKVAARLKASGGPSIDYVPITGLAMSGCDYHPSVADDEKIAEALEKVIDSYRDVWVSKGERG
jgi:lysophospholipase L1-like esterase